MKEYEINDQGLNPGDEAEPGTVGTGDDVCPDCKGSGTLGSGKVCPTCNGTGRVIEGIGGG
jgi:DnaJ-class molecular chaperone